MGATIGVKYENTVPLLNTTDNPAQNPQDVKWGKVGLELSTGNRDGKRNGKSKFGYLGGVSGTVSYTDQKGCEAGFSGHAGTEYSFNKAGCHGGWFTTLGLGAVAETAGKYEVISPDLDHEASIYAGASGQLAYRGPYHELKVGFRGGWEQKGSLHIDKENNTTYVNKDCRKGRAVYGPSFSVFASIPGTQAYNKVLAGLNVGATVYYDIPSKELYTQLGVRYTF